MQQGRIDLGMAGHGWIDSAADHVVGGDDLLLPFLGVHQHVTNPCICQSSILPLTSANEFGQTTNPCYCSLGKMEWGMLGCEVSHMSYTRCICTGGALSRLGVICQAVKISAGKT